MADAMKPVWPAEREVGVAVYERVEKLVAANPSPGTSDWAELDYLSHLTESVEEVGEYDGPLTPLAASPPAREEASAEGAVSDADILRDTVPADLLDAELARLNDFWGVRMEGSEHVYPSVRATEAGAQKLASRLNALSSEGPRYVTAALRNRTSEPEAGAVAWRARMRPDGEWMVLDAEYVPGRSADDAVEVQPLYTHPAPATADKLPDDVKRLVLAARAVAFGPLVPDASSVRSLDQASEAFADRVPWDDAPLATLNEQPQ